MALYTDGFAETSLMKERNFKPRDKIMVEFVERKVIQKEGDITKGINMAVKVDIVILEGVDSYGLIRHQCS